jgi:hypothetical protein
MPLLNAVTTVALRCVLSPFRMAWHEHVALAGGCSVQSHTCHVALDRTGCKLPVGFPSVPAAVLPHTHTPYCTRCSSPSGTLRHETLEKQNLRTFSNFTCTVPAVLGSGLSFPLSYWRLFSHSIEGGKAFASWSTGWLWSATTRPSSPSAPLSTVFCFMDLLNCRAGCVKRRRAGVSAGAPGGGIA